MSYELHLKADTIADLAHQAAYHAKALSAIIGGEPRTAVELKSSNPVLPLHEAESENAPDVTGQVDMEGMPWDERIHSSNRKMTAKGVWTRRKNVDEAVYNQVVAELRGNSLPQQYTPAIPAYAQPAAPLEVSSFLQTMAQPQPVAPTVSYTIQDLFVKLQQLNAVGSLNNEYLGQICQSLSQQFGVAVNSVNDIGGRPDMIAAVFQKLAQDGK